MIISWQDLPHLNLYIPSLDPIGKSKVYERSSVEYNSLQTTGTHIPEFCSIDTRISNNNAIGFL